MMNVATVLDNSHTLLLQAIADLPQNEWEIPGVCGEWSVREIVAHLASYERLLIDIMHNLQGQEPTPAMHSFRKSVEEFDRPALEARKHLSAQQVLDEYLQASAQEKALLARMTPEQMHQAGMMPCSDTSARLADFVNMMCEHSAEHHNDIIKFRQQHSGEVSRA